MWGDKNGPNPKRLPAPYTRALHTDVKNGARALPSAPTLPREVVWNMARAEG